MNKGLATVCLVALVAVGCSDDDDDAVETTQPTETVVNTTVVVETTEAAPETTSPPPTTVADPTTTTMSEEALRAQIAADYLRSWQLRRELIGSPTLEDLDTKLAQISAPGSENLSTLQAFVMELVALNERVVPGTPDHYRIEVERVDLLGSAPYHEAVVTMCFVRSLGRADATGTVRESGLVASRSEDHVVLTPNGWLPDGDLQDVWQGLEVTECPAA